MPISRKIVLAVDDSPISQEAVEWASKKLLNPSDEVHLISVLDPGKRPEISLSGESSFVLLENTDCKPNPLQLEQRAKMLKKYQAAVAANSGSKNVKMTTLVSCIGGSSDVGRHICEYAAENKADLLIMGSRGMGAAQRSIMNLFGLGSVSEFVLRHGLENVLVHRRQ
jgi:nucleotide-binding universal stress UspA family protein